MLGEGDLDGTLKGLLRMFGFRDDCPLLEEGGETVGIEALAGGGIQNPDLPVALQQRLGKMVPSSGPDRGPEHLPEVDGLMADIPHKGVIQPEGGIGKMRGKSLLGP